MTAFFWSQNTGILAASTDEDMVKYYKKAIQYETGSNLDDRVTERPCIRAPFTNWDAVEMHEVVQFCKLNDVSPPDFLGELSREGSVRFACVGDDPKPLNPIEQEALDNYR